MKSVTTIFFTLLCLYSAAQSEKINVAENTLKIKGLSEEVFYYAFAEGDQLIFNFQSVDNKELKEVEIIEYPNNSRFMEYKTKKVENRVLTVPRSGVYLVRLVNGHFIGRVCQIRIDRVPANAKTKAFNTAVKWVEKPDTTWNVYTKDVLIGYDTLLLYKTKKELIKTEINEDLFMQKDERVNSRMNPNGNQAVVYFSIPSYPSSELIIKKVISFAYWIGVGEESNRQWEKNSKTIKNITKTGAAFLTPLGAFALGAVADLALPSNGEIVEYSLVNRLDNSTLDYGKGIGGRQKFVDPVFLKGPWYITLTNINYMAGIDVNVKLSVIVQTDYLEEKPYTEQKITPRYESKTFKEPIIKLNKIPIVIN